MNEQHSPSQKTVAEKVRLMTARNQKLRLEKFSRGKPFMHFSSSTPNLCYYEYADGRLEVWQLDTNELLRTLTGEPAAQTLSEINIPQS